jgi:hypothetical protein
LLPLINGDERGFSERNIFVFDQRSSAFISGQLGFLIFQQAPRPDATRTYSQLRNCLIEIAVQFG